MPTKIVPSCKKANWSRKGSGIEMGVVDLKEKTENMKKFKMPTAVVFAILSIGIFSCGNESVRHTKKEPFVIMRIEKFDDGKVKYSKGGYERPFKEFFAVGLQSITFDSDLGYKIGDTLSFKSCH